MTYGLDGVTARFGNVVALDDVTVTVRPGQVTAVVGGDGAGKTTLLRTVVGQVQPDSGVVTAPPPSEIGYLPSSAGSWLDLTVQQNVDFVGGAYGLRGSSLRDRGRALLQRADLTGVLDRPAGQLSGGMRRKLGFVLAMLPQPTLVVLDEPSTGVDPVSRVDLWRLISEVAAQGTAVLLSTTYLDEAERCATVCVLQRGRVLLEGTRDDILGSLRGAIVRTPRPVRNDLAWRRGRSFHEWWPEGLDGDLPPGSETVAPDLEDVVIASSLQTGGAGG